MSKKQNLTKYADIILHLEGKVEKLKCENDKLRKQLVVWIYHGIQRNNHG